MLKILGSRLRFRAWASGLRSYGSRLKVCTPGSASQVYGVVGFRGFRFQG